MLTTLYCLLTAPATASNPTSEPLQQQQELQISPSPQTQRPSQVAETAVARSLTTAPIATASAFWKRYNNRVPGRVIVLHEAVPLNASLLPSTPRSNTEVDIASDYDPHSMAPPKAPASGRAKNTLYAQAQGNYDYSSTSIKSGTGETGFAQLVAATSEDWDDGDDDFVTQFNKISHVSNSGLERASSMPKPRPSLDNAANGASDQRSHRATGSASAVPQRKSSSPSRLGKELSRSSSTNSNALASQQYASRLSKFNSILDQPNVDLAALSKIAWNGIPAEVRPMAWQLLMGYLPINFERREATLQRKRKEYSDISKQVFGRGIGALDQTIWHQIHIDIPRTHPKIPLFHHKVVQEALERILYIWAIRRPASGYVQGINDLVTPFFAVFLGEYIATDDFENYDPTELSPETLEIIEADSFWCFSKLLDGIQDNYTQSQPGIQRQVNKLKDLVNRIDARLHNHLSNIGIEYLQFAFRWMNCLLVRELSLRNIIRMWDTYHAEGSDGFAVFQIYVCAAFLVKFSEEIRSKDFQHGMTFIQNLPTENWTEKDIELLLSEAFMWKSLFHNAPSHLSSK